jgi:hypothetical protein
VKYHFNEEVKIGDKTFDKDTDLEITADQIGELTDEARLAFNEAINDGRVSPVEPHVPKSEDVTDLPKEQPSVPEETASASPAVEPSADVPVEAAKTSEPVKNDSKPENPVKLSGWVGGHTIGQENKRPGGSLTTRDPNLSRKQ